MPQPDDDSLLDRLFAPLEAMSAAALSSEQTAKPDKLAIVEQETILEAGHYLDSYDNQVAFFEKPRGGLADQRVLEGLLTKPHPIRSGERIRLCGKHILTVEDIIEPPHRWVELLGDGQVFVPWPDVLAADFFTESSSPAVLVQPDPVLAGILINYYLSRYGESCLELL